MDNKSLGIAFLAILAALVGLVVRFLPGVGGGPREPTVMITPTSVFVMPLGEISFK